MRSRQGKNGITVWLLFSMAACNQIGGIQDGTLRECFTVDDCLIAVPECREAKACQDTRCIFEDAPEETPISEQTTGDCAKIVCDGAGKTKRAAQTEDVADDGDPCTFDECVETTPVHTRMTELPCYTGPAQTRNIGVCADGIQYCDAAGNPTSECQGEVLPRPETCLYPLDEDCDGESNEEGDACVCKPGEITSCYTGPAGTEGIGICHAGMQKCNSDGLGQSPCGEQAPEQEVCDALALDQDCDGQSEEGGICYCGDGIVSAGEDCDDGNASDGDDCPPDCQLVIIQPAAGSVHTCVAFDKGRPKCWGRNVDGSLGLGLGNPMLPVTLGDEPDEMGQKLPFVNLGTGKRVKAIAAGAYHSCTLFTDNSIKCWGANDFGRLGLGDTAPRGEYSNQMGDNLPAVDLGSGKTALAIAMGWNHTCAMLSDGSVKCWGGNSFGALGLGNSLDRGDDPGEMGDFLPVVDLGTGKTAKAIAGGYSHTCVILNDDTIKCWGGNWSGALGLGNWLSRGDDPGEMGDFLPVVDLGTGKTAKAIATCHNHTCAILNDGTVKCWGDNNSGQLGLGDTNDRGDNPNEMGDNLPAVNLGTGRTAQTIAVGWFHTCAILDDNSIKCWGDNVFGELGLGDTNHRGNNPNEMGDALPAVNLGTGRTAQTIAVGGNHTCAILDDNSIKCWGDNFGGQLGLGHTNTLGDQPGEMGDDLPVVKAW